MNSDNSKSQTYIVLEILCVFFWFLLDGFWLMEWKLLTHWSSAIAIALGCAMFFFIRKDKVVILVACADMCWLLFNVLWAVGDLEKIPKAVYAAKLLFLAGGLFCIAAFSVADARKRLQTLILSRLRIMKYFERA